MLNIAGDYPHEWRRLRLLVLSQVTGEVRDGVHVAQPRVIGIFPSLGRVHMRARRRLVSEWERPFGARA